MCCVETREERVDQVVDRYYHHASSRSRTKFGVDIAAVWRVFSSRYWVFAYVMLDIGRAHET